MAATTANDEDDSVMATIVPGNDVEVQDNTDKYGKVNNGSSDGECSGLPPEQILLLGAVSNEVSSDVQAEKLFNNHMEMIVNLQERVDALKNELL